LRRQQWLEANGPCALCGGTTSLQVDHLDPAKKVSHNVWSWSEPRRLAELTKCRVLCSECHKKKSETERARGEDVGSAKLTWEQVQRIRENGESAEKLAKILGVHRATIFRVRQGVIWKRCDP
jgi:5-methylcytosine-specific restriction endonuclease McrA